MVLTAIVGANYARHNMPVATVLDPGIALGAGQDGHQCFRVSTRRHLRALCVDLAIGLIETESKDRTRIAEEAMARDIAQK